MLSLSILLILVVNFYSAARTCKTTILRSFGYKSRITPNQFNPICPSVSYNCCTQTDIMKIHKAWVNVYKNKIISVHRKTVEMVNKLPKLFEKTEVLTFKEFTTKFKQFVNPPTRFFAHLMRVSQLIQQGLPKAKEAYKELTEKNLLESMYKDTLHMRQGIVCGLCSWHNSPFIDMEGKVLIYRNRFCLRVIAKHIDTIDSKYNKLFKYFLLIDEFIRLITGRSVLTLMQRRIFHRYGNLATRCLKNPTKIEACGEICRELNVNRFSYMFDGEPEFIQGLIMRMNKRAGKLKKVTSDEEMRSLFKFRAKEWAARNLDHFLLNDSVTSSRVIELPMKKPRKTSFEARITQSGTKSFLEYRHPSNSIQLDMLDDQMSHTLLYRLMDKPTDISTFIIIFDPVKGLDFYRDAKGSQFDATVDQLLGMLHTGGADTSKLNEIVDDSVKAVIAELEIVDIKDFNVDAKMFFKKFKAKKMKVNDKNKPRKLKYAPINLALGFFLTIVGFLIL